MVAKISGWVDLTGEVGGEGKTVFSNITADTGISITKSVVVNTENEWYVEVKGNRVPAQSPSLEGAPPHIHSTADITSLLQHIDSCNICPGNPDEKYITVSGAGHSQS